MKTTFQTARMENRVRAAIIGQPLTAATELELLKARVARLEGLLVGPAQIIPSESLPERIRRIVAHHYKLTVDEMIEHFRTEERVWPRFVTAYLCRKLTRISSPALGKLLGHRDHGACLHGVKMVKQRMTIDNPFAREVEVLEARVKAIQVVITPSSESARVLSGVCTATEKQ